MRIIAFSVFVCCFLSTAVCSGQYMTTFAGTGMVGYTGDYGPASLAELKTPSGVATDRYGNIYITDQNSNCIRKVDTTGTITSVAGRGTSGYAGDGGPATAAGLFWPEGVAIDDGGNVFIADQFNNVIRKVWAATGIITTIAGNNALIGYSGDGGQATAAALWHPADVAVDRSGNVYFVDQDNSLVRKVNTVTGIITTVAGIPDSAGYSGDGGPGTAAKLNFPQGIATDTAGNIYVADFYNSRIRKISAATGVINTVVGNGVTGFSGDGGPASAASLYDASAVAIDDTGNIYISDYGNSRIRKVKIATGVITTVAGNGTAAYCCDCHLATAAEMYFPQGVAVDRKGNIYIADFGNARVRRVSDSLYCPSLGIVEAGPEQQLMLVPNPSQGRFSIHLNELHGDEKAVIYDMLGTKVYESSFYKPAMDVDLEHPVPGIYMVCIISGKIHLIDRLIISY